MIDITHKPTTLRSATAQAIVRVSDPQTINAVRQGTVPKGNVLESARVAALFGVKKTHELIPDCHPLPIEHAECSFELGEMDITITMRVRTIYRTGVEVEAMHGASVAALTMYDMLKPIDKGIELHAIKLIEKKGGKSDFRSRYRDALTATVIVCSDTISKGKKEDKAGKAIMAKLEACGVRIAHQAVIPDETSDIQQQVRDAVERGSDMVIFTGGTGLSPRDVTPEALRPLLEREIPGIAEVVRDFGQARTPYAMLSRALAGTIGTTLVLALPGSTKGATESMDALFPPLLHLFGIMRSAAHDGPDVPVQLQ
ncbi:MAG: bifunctional molybdenum cofactor biosynthesis protein MoaC/MoaB [Flavobacteriales bacterium]|nr:bifunctional molybdenum cofactor biosynthesis protein MoaC/MoaB [Flavobacteriales bacterium]